MLLSDTRLKKHIAIPPGDISIGKLFQKIEHTATVRLYTEDTELQVGSMNIGVRGKSTASLMDAVSSLWLARWEKDRLRRYKFLPNEREANSLGARNRFQRARAPIEQQFINDLRQLSPRDRITLLSGQLFSTRILPPGMLGTLRKIAEEVNREQVTNGWSNPFPLDRLNQSHFSLVPKNRNGTTTLRITLRLSGWGTMGWLTRNSQTPTPAEQAKLALAIHTPKKFEIKPDDALALPFLQQQITLKAKNVTFTEVLKTLHQRYRISYVADESRFFPQRANVDLEPVTHRLQRSLR